MSVYFAQPAGGGLIKIGNTVGVTDRLRSIGAWHPEHIEPLHVISGGPVRERLLQRLLKPHQHRREWFRSNATVWRLILDAIDTDLPWLPAEPAKEMGTTGPLAGDLVRRVGSPDAVCSLLEISRSSLAQYTTFSTATVWAGLLILDMEDAGTIPAYFDWRPYSIKARAA